MGEAAQKLIAGVIGLHRYNISDVHVHRCICGDDIGRADDALDSHRAAEIDKALGGLTLAWAAVLPDNSYFGAYHEAYESSPGEARKQAEADVAEYEDTTLKPRWVSGWSEEP